VIWRFRTGSQWREIPPEFGSWSTVYHRFAQWRDADVFGVLLQGMIAEAASRGQVEMSLVSVDSTVARAHHDSAGMQVSEGVLAALEEAAEKANGVPERGNRSGSRRAGVRKAAAGQNAAGFGGDIARG
jgi:transposase